jgi:hypothetical protein
METTVNGRIAYNWRRIAEDERDTAAFLNVDQYRPTMHPREREMMELLPYVIRFGEWPAIAKALEKEFPERVWNTGAKLTEENPWQARTSGEALPRDSVICLITCGLDANRMLKQVTPSVENTIQKWLNPKYTYGWRNIEAISTSDIGSLVYADKYRPKIANRLNELEF